ncbi:MAG: winged helix-turn-helix transcriptional regulator [Methanomassiliicoccus sp.]|nr:winged helix-turn-helix transcriptional regulator [Methanomassiliicoccus sp.]
MKDEEATNVLDIDHVFSILRYLECRSGEEVLASELRAVMPNYGRMMLIVGELEGKGLVEIRTETKPRKRYILSLTERGHVVARKLQALDDLIQSWQ